MAYVAEYETGLIGKLVLASNDGSALDGCWFDNDRYLGYGAQGERQRNDDLPVLVQARDWLGRYFAGEAPDPHELPLGPAPTAFQQQVREAMLRIPYGATTTYGEIARSIEASTGKRQSARAVGGAVGRNPLCVIVPCHRVVGAHGNLTGFGGGIPTKIKLLQHEGADMQRFYVPKTGKFIIPDSSRLPFGGGHYANR